MQDQVDNFSNMETIGKIQLKILKIKSIVTEGKNNFKGLIFRQKTTKERFNENKDSLLGITQIEKQRKK